MRCNPEFVLRVFNMGSRMFTPVALSKSLGQRHRQHSGPEPDSGDISKSVIEPERRLAHKFAGAARKHDGNRQREMPSLKFQFILVSVRIFSSFHVRQRCHADFNRGWNMHAGIFVPPRNVSSLRSLRPPCGTPSNPVLGGRLEAFDPDLHMYAAMCFHLLSWMSARRPAEC
jgi:hypothetical protein